MDSKFKSTISRYPVRKLHRCFSLFDPDSELDKNEVMRQLNMKDTENSDSSGNGKVVI